MKTKLFEGAITPKQGLIIGIWLANLVIVLLIWIITSIDILTTGGVSGILTGTGRLFGLLAAFFALTQFMLMGRLKWLERPFGLDHLASYHRKNGNYAFFFLFIHPIFITLGYAFASQTNVVRQYIDLVLNYPYVWLAFIAQILFIAVAITSVYIVRKHLRFESWYYVHLLVYIAIATAFLHQVEVGGSFAAYPLAKTYWFALYGFVAINLIIWRFSLPVYTMYAHNLQVKRVVRETPTTVSVYIGGKNLAKWRASPGQFVLVRMLAAGYWTQEHPFSLSSVVTDEQLRITIREIGDYTKTIKYLKPGTKVLLSGPFGRFTRDIAKFDGRLYIAGGVGITPIRSLIEQSIADNKPSYLIYGNRDPADVVFTNEIKELEGKGLKLFEVFSNLPADYSGKAISGYVTGDVVADCVPDFKKCDIYLCGPPPMMAGVIEGLTKKGAASEQLHYEIFDLHK